MEMVKTRTQQLAVLLAFCLVYSFVQLTPTIAGYLSQAPGKIFLGFESPDDYYTYAAYVKESQHDIFIENKNTPEPQLGRYFLPQFWLMAQFVNLGVGIPAVFLVFRFFEVLFLLGCIWLFLGLFFQGFRKRFFSLAFISLAGGIGWLVIALSNFLPVLARVKSSDITYYLGYSLVGNLYVIHRYWALGLALLGFIFILKFLSSGKKNYLVATGTCALAMFFIHPVTAIFFICTITLMGALLVLYDRGFLRKAAAFLAATALFMLPALAYSFWASQDPLIAEHQKIYFFTPKIEPLPFYFVGFGMVLVLGMLGLWKIREEKPLKALLLAWVAASFILTRIGFGAEYLVFFYLIMAVFAAKWLISAESRAPKIALFVLAAACVLSAPFVLLERANSAASNPISFITPDEASAIGFLSAQEPGIVLSDRRIGEILTFNTDHRVFMSHPFLTMNIKEKAIDYRNFLDGNNSLFGNYHIDYLWVDKNNMPKSLDYIPGLSLMYSNARFEVYSLVGT